MLKAFLSRQLARFERDFDYDAAYMHDLLDAGAGRFIKFGFVASLGHGKAAPAEAMAAAGIVATLAEDCGPCTQIGVDMAERGGVAPEVLRAVLAGDEAAMGETARLGYRFARAVLAHDGPGSDWAREAIEALWGKTAVVDLSLAIMTGRMYPTLKYGMGHAKTCSRVTVAGAPVAFSRPESLAA